MKPSRRKTAVAVDSVEAVVVVDQAVAVVATAAVVVAVAVVATAVVVVVAAVAATAAIAIDPSEINPPLSSPRLFETITLN
jgi:hypothetical protein